MSTEEILDDSYLYKIQGWKFIMNNLIYVAPINECREDNRTKKNDDLHAKTLCSVCGMIDRNRADHV